MSGTFVQPCGARQFSYLAKPKAVDTVTTIF
jgi:hypothetical protein